MKARKLEVLWLQKYIVIIECRIEMRCCRHGLRNASVVLYPVVVVIVDECCVRDQNFGRVISGSMKPISSATHITMSLLTKVLRPTQTTNHCTTIVHRHIHAPNQGISLSSQNQNIKTKAKAKAKESKQKKMRRARFELASPPIRQKHKRR